MATDETCSREHSFLVQTGGLYTPSVAQYPATAHDAELATEPLKSCLAMLDVAETAIDYFLLLHCVVFLKQSLQLAASFSSLAADLCISLEDLGLNLLEIFLLKACLDEPSQCQTRNVACLVFS